MIVDAYVRRAVGFKPGTIVHVGGHLAQELKEYEALRPHRIVWIEADRAVAEEMARRVAARGDQGVEHICVQALVTEKDGDKVTLHVFSNDGASSSVFSATDTLRRTWPDVKETGEATQQKSSRLDTILRSKSVEPDDVDVLVLDIQGAELLCLKGAGAYLDHVCFVEVEVSQEAIYDGGVLFPELDGFLFNAGFARVSPVPWHGDTVYVRRSDLARPGFRHLRALAEAPDNADKATHRGLFRRIVRLIRSQTG